MTAAKPEVWGRFYRGVHAPNAGLTDQIMVGAHHQQAQDTGR